MPQVACRPGRRPNCAPAPDLFRRCSFALAPLCFGVPLTGTVALWTGRTVSWFRSGRTSLTAFRSHFSGPAQGIKQREDPPPGCLLAGGVGLA